jgi:hypothetical protein
MPLNLREMDIDQKKKEDKRAKLQAKLRDKLGQSRMKRQTKQNKEKVLTTTLEKSGVDPKRVKAALELLEKHGLQHELKK